MQTIYLWELELIQNFHYQKLIFEKKYLERKLKPELILQTESVIFLIKHQHLNIQIVLM